MNFWKTLKKPFIALAPMEGVTDYVFREIVATKLPKPDVMFTEFTNVDALNSDGFEKTISRFKFSKNQRPIIAQIWGTNLENFYKSAKLISKLGFDGIDINMGCPVHDVMKIGAGSALINSRSLVKKIISSVKKGSEELPVSVKTRLGTKEIITNDWITFLLEQKINALTIHGRVSKQMSGGLADWEEIGKAVQLKNKISPSTKIIGNGDIESYSQALEMYKKYNVDGIMIARGIFKNPWVFDSKTQEHLKEEYVAVLQKHLDLYEKTWGDTKSFDPMKKFFKMYINNFPRASVLRQKLMETKTIKEAKTLLLLQEEKMLQHI